MPRAGAPFAHPIGYELLWKDEKKSSVSFWAPIPPEGYVALGRVVTADNGKSKEQKQPSKKSFCCVREDFARERVLLVLARFGNLKGLRKCTVILKHRFRPYIMPVLLHPVVGPFVILETYTFWRTIRSSNKRSYQIPGIDEELRVKFSFRTNAG